MKIKKLNESIVNRLVNTTCTKCGSKVKINVDFEGTSYNQKPDITCFRCPKCGEVSDYINESISSQEPAMKFSGRSSHTFTKDKKWEVDFDEKGNILARTRKGKPQYFKGHINDKTNSFPSTDEDNIILAAREQHSLKFGKGPAVKESIGDFKIYGDEETLRQLERDLCESFGDSDIIEDKKEAILSVYEAHYGSCGKYIEQFLLSHGASLEVERIFENVSDEAIEELYDRLKDRIVKLYGPDYDELNSGVFELFGLDTINEDVPMEYTDSDSLKALADEDEYYNEQRARRKHNLELLHKIFDSHGYRDSEERWTDKVFDLFRNAEEITVVDDASKVPSKTNDGTKVRYVISTPDAEVDVHVDVYGDYVWVVTKQPLNESFKIYESTNTQFKVGDKFTHSGLYGGTYTSIVKSINGNKLNVETTWTSEDDGSIKSADRIYKITTDDEGNECIVVWEYNGSKGYVYPPSFNYQKPSNSPEDIIKDLVQDMCSENVLFDFCNSYEEFVEFLEDGNVKPTKELYRIFLDERQKCKDEILKVNKDYFINEDLSGKYSDKFRQFIRNYTDSASIVSLVDDIVRYAKEDDLKDLYFERGYDALEDDKVVDYDLTESFNEKDILNKLDQFKSQITIKPEDEKALKDILLKKNISFKIDDSKEDKLTFKLKYKKPIKEGFEEDVQTVQRYLTSELPDILLELSNKIDNVYDCDVEVLLKNCRSFYNLCESMVRYYNRHSNLEEDLTDVATATLNGPTEGPQFGLTELINTAMQNELETVNEYNTLALNARSEGFEDIANVIDEINTEENKHIGQLQELLKTISPNAEAIEVGKVEGEQQIDENIETVNKSEETPNTNDEEVLGEDTMNNWQSIYNKFKQIEKDLNGDGEAITAVINNMYNDNKGNPAYETAYKKWADGAVD